MFPVEIAIEQGSMLSNCSIEEEKDDCVHCVDSGERGVAHNHHHVDVLEINSFLRHSTFYGRVLTVEVVGSSRDSIMQVLRI